MEFTFAPIITIDKTCYLEVLIEDFLSEFQRLYPERPLVPKMHYLVHTYSIMDQKVSVSYFVLKFISIKCDYCLDVDH